LTFVFGRLVRAEREVDLDPFRPADAVQVFSMVERFFERFVKCVSALSILAKVETVTGFLAGITSDLQREKRRKWPRCPSAVNRGPNSRWLLMMRLQHDPPYRHQLWHSSAANQDSWLYQAMSLRTRKGLLWFFRWLANGAALQPMK